jgi:hypothetical protein
MVSSDTEKKMKSVDFEGAYCVGFTEHWEDKQGDDQNALSHWEEIVISCQKIVNGPISFKNQWK